MIPQQQIARVSRSRPLQHHHKLDLFINIPDPSQKVQIASCRNIGRTYSINSTRLSHSQSKTRYQMPSRVKDTVSQSKLESLQSRNMELVQQLEMLREGAVSALIEKDSMIESLKESMKIEKLAKEERLQDTLEEKQVIELKLETLMRELQQRSRELDCLRKEYHQTIGKKNRVIFELGEQLETAQRSAKKLEIKEAMLQKMLQDSEEARQALVEELDYSRLSLSMLRENMCSSSLKGSIVHETHEMDTQESLREKSDSSEQICLAELQRVAELWEKQEQVHKQQVLSIRQTYEGEIRRMKKQYQEHLVQILMNIKKNSCGSGEDSQQSQSNSENSQQPCQFQMQPSTHNFRLLREEIEDEQPKSSGIRPEDNCDLKSEFSKRHFIYQPRVFMDDGASTRNTLRPTRDSLSLLAKPRISAGSRPLTLLKSIGINTQTDCGKCSEANSPKHRDDRSLWSDLSMTSVGGVMGSICIAMGVGYALLKKTKII